VWSIAFAAEATSLHHDNRELFIARTPDLVVNVHLVDGILPCVKLRIGGRNPLEVPVSASSSGNRSGHAQRNFLGLQTVSPQSLPTPPRIDKQRKDIVSVNEILRSFRWHSPVCQSRYSPFGPIPSTILGYLRYKIRILISARVISPREAELTSADICKNSRLVSCRPAPPLAAALLISRHSTRLHFPASMIETMSLPHAHGIGPPRAASGRQIPAINPRVSPLNRPSVSMPHLRQSPQSPQRPPSVRVISPSRAPRGPSSLPTDIALPDLPCSPLRPCFFSRQHPAPVPDDRVFRVHTC